MKGGVPHVFPAQTNAPPAAALKALNGGYTIKWMCTECGELFAIRQATAPSCRILKLRNIQALFDRYVEALPGGEDAIGLWVAIDAAMKRELGWDKAEREWMSVRFRDWREWQGQPVHV